MAGVPFRLDQWKRVICVSGLLCVLALQLLHVAKATSSSWDEAHHLFDGYTIWKLDDYRLNPEVPPFIKLTAALPLLPMQLKTPPNLGAGFLASTFKSPGFVHGVASASARARRSSP